MQKPFELFEEQCMRRMAAECSAVLDVGGGTRFMKGMKKFETLFAKCDYKTMDVSADYHPDLVGDIHAIPLADASVDGVMCRSVLEHVERPWDAVREIHRILKPGGLAFIQVPSTYPYHARLGFGAYPDYWRFFESTMRLMMKDFEHVQIQKQGGWFQAMSYFMPGQVHVRRVLDAGCAALDGFFQTESKTTTAVLYCFGKK